MEEQIRVIGEIKSKVVLVNLLSSWNIIEKRSREKYFRYCHYREKCLSFVLLRNDALDVSLSVKRQGDWMNQVGL